MMNNKLIKKIEKLVKRTCRKESNPFSDAPFSDAVFRYHIDSVVKYSRLLAKKLKADEEVAVLGALLHDFASITHKDLYPEHHIHGTRLAEEILKKYNYPKEKIEAVKHCVYTHRGSRKIPRKTLEAKIVASADAMAHFDNVNALFHAGYVTFGLDVDNGTKWVLDKLERSYKKLLPEGKKMVERKYKEIKRAMGTRD